MKSTDPIKIEKVPFPEKREAPKQKETNKSENEVYEPTDFKNGYKCLYTDQIRNLDEKIRAFGYQAPVLKDQEKQSFFIFNRAKITEILRRLRILSISQTAIYTIEDLEDIKGLGEPIYASISESILASEDPKETAVLLSDKNSNEMKDALEKIPDELISMVRDREWMAAYDQWNATFFCSPPATWFYDDINPEDCCRIIILAALDEIESWLEEEASPDSLITHVELPHRNVGYHIAGKFNYEEQCMEIYSNAPLKGLTVKLIKDEEAELGFWLEELYPDTGDIY